MLLQVGFTLCATLVLAANSQTIGCSRPAATNPGTTTEEKITVDGLSRKYRIHIPEIYNPDEKTPVVFSFHGWGSSASFNEGYMGFTSLSDSRNFIMVYPEGESDYQRASNNGWQSFNAVGSTTTLGNECTQSTTGYCYQSCKSRNQGCGRCDWTTCADDTAFVTKILDVVEALYCVDQDRIYATGYSNGGMMAYEIGMKMTDRFAAIVPGGGQPFVGHNNPPPTSNSYISVLDLHGSRDTTCPANSTTSSDGWNYEPVDNVLQVWADANGCSVPRDLDRFSTDEDGEEKLYCVRFGKCPSGVDIVRCSYNAAHQWLGYSKNGGVGARLAWTFMRNHPKVRRASGVSEE